ncbi:MAG: hypothetical protein GQ574_14910 [Crocinitomix sp.]|nr:hypothetical protein [Crocinitomix sp.]
MKNVEINPGEIKVKFDKPVIGKVSFADLGITDADLHNNTGFMRIVFDLEGIGEHQYFQVPTIEVSYKENLAATHWICEFNGKTLVDKIDNHGHSTVMLLNRKTIADAEHHHENKLMVHAEFPEETHLIAAESYINIFK